MNDFTDLQERKWSVRLTVGLLGVIRRETGIELGRAILKEESLVEIVWGDPEKLAQVLWLIVEPQAKVLDVTPEDFVAAIDGQVLESAVEALLKAIIDFFPRAAIAKALKENLQEAMTAMDNAAIEKLNQSKTQRFSDGNLQDSPDSILVTSPSENSSSLPTRGKGRSGTARR